MPRQVRLPTQSTTIISFGTYTRGSDSPATFYTDWNRVGNPATAVIALIEVGDTTGTTPTVDCWLETRLGDSWFEVVRFHQISTTAGRNNVARAYKISATEPEDSVSTAGGVLTEGDVAHFIGNEWRVRYVIDGGDDSSGADFGITLIPVW